MSGDDLGMRTVSSSRVRCRPGIVRRWRRRTVKGNGYLLYDVVEMPYVLVVLRLQRHVSLPLFSARGRAHGGTCTDGAILLDLLAYELHVAWGDCGSCRTRSCIAVSPLHSFPLPPRPCSSELRQKSSPRALPWLSNRAQGTASAYVTAAWESNRLQSHPPRQSHLCDAPSASFSCCLCSLRASR